MDAIIKVAMKLVKVNDIEVRPLPKDSSRHIVRSSIVKEPNNLTLFASHKKSGKTTAIYHFLKDAIAHYPLQLDSGGSRQTERPRRSKIEMGYGNEDISQPEKPKYHRKLTVFLYSGTALNDEVYKHIIDLLRQSGVKYQIETSTYDEDGVNLVAQMTNFIKDLTANQEMKNEIFGGTKEDKITEEIKQHLTPLSGVGDFICIFDDISDEMKSNKQIEALIKIMKNLHISHILCSSQSATDFSRNMWDNADNIVMFQKMPDDRLKHIYDRAALAIPYEEFKDLYQEATKTEVDGQGQKKKNFFMIDKGNGKYYKNFNKEFLVGGASNEVQSVVFPKELFTLAQAKTWLRKHKYKIPQVDDKTNTYRFRQQPPEDYSEFRNKKLPNGVILVLGYNN
jgi:hypothetical protein